ncbi:MAG: hypothetical protein ACOX52_10510 [Verrucomicrobiota bacterium]
MPISQIIVEIEIEIGIDPCPVCHLALMDCPNFAAEWCQHRNKTEAGPGVSCLNPIRYRDR